MPMYKGRDVEAFQIGSGPLPDWIKDLEPCGPDQGKSYVVVETYKGKKSISVDDWIVRLPNGNLKKMTDEKFRDRYQVEPTSRMEPRIKPAVHKHIV